MGMYIEGCFGVEDQ